MVGQYNPPRKSGDIFLAEPSLISPSDMEREEQSDAERRAGHFDPSLETSDVKQNSAPAESWAKIGVVGQTSTLIIVTDQAATNLCPEPTFRA